MYAYFIRILTVLEVIEKLVFPKKPKIVIPENRQANIEELTRTGGNVEAAVDRLLTRPR